MADEAKKRVVISGGSGLLGGAIARAVGASGYEVARLVRGTPGANEVKWDPLAGELDAAAVAGAHAFIHLSGESVGAGRWNEKKKQLILESRTKSTALLANAIAKMTPKPAAFLVASAIGYYGSDRGDEELSESSSSGSDFLAGVCRAWEDASLPAKKAGVRTVNLRFGVVLAKDGSALAKMLPVFRLGLGARVGSGKQVMSSIGLEDAARAVLFALETPALEGPVNVVAPRPVTNAEFTEKLAKALGKGTALPVPAFVLRAAYGEMAKETVLASQRVVPSKLVEAGFEFLHGGLLGALRAELER
jgi:uncharacterized protein (TIGR01777 family)